MWTWTIDVCEWPESEHNSDAIDFPQNRTMRHRRSVELKKQEVILSWEPRSSVEQGLRSKT